MHLSTITCTIILRVLNIGIIIIIILCIMQSEKLEQLNTLFEVVDVKRKVGKNCCVLKLLAVFTHSAERYQTISVERLVLT